MLLHNRRRALRTKPPALTRALTLSAVFALALAGSCVRKPNPQSAFDHAQRAFERGDIAAAADESQRGYDLFRDTQDDWAWRFLILKARSLQWQGMNQDVLALLQSIPPTAPNNITIGKLRLEGVAFASLHDFAQANRVLTEAENLCANNNDPLCIDVLSARGKIEMEHGRFPQAQEIFVRVLAAAQAQGGPFRQAGALLNLSWAADEQTHFDEALDWAAAARKISLDHGFADVAQTALGNIAWAYYKLGDLEKGEELLLQAGKEAEKLADTSDQLRWLTDVGYIQMESDQPKAEQSFQQALRLANQLSSREDVINSVIALAIVSEQANKLEAAQRYADQALSMARADGNQRDIVYPLLVEARVSARKGDTASAQAKFQEVAKSQEAPVFLKWEAERSLARLYEDQNQPGPAAAEYQTALATFENARCGHNRIDSRLPFLSNAARIYEDYIHFLVSRGQAEDALLVADYARARTLAEGLGKTCTPTFAPDQLNATEIARKAGGTILFYSLGQEHSYLWAITPNQLRLFPLSANQPQIEAAVSRYRKKIEGPPQILDASNDAVELYNLLVAPAQSLLTPVARTVFIVADGALNSLNFETLMTPPHHYWLESATIQNAASLRMLPASRAPASALKGSLLLIGDPATPTSIDTPYPQLPNAAAQLQIVQKYFSPDQVQVFTRSQASPAAYLSSHPEQFSYIHFVAHGTASRISPLDSAIILSPDPGSRAPTQDDSFKLYARNIISTPRLRAELVTISACYSSGNRTYSGEGLVGLSWAFLRAGAHNVIAALWDVSDASTPQLVDSFYSELKKGKSPPAALREAKLSLLHSESFRRPFYWGPFQLYTGP